MRSSLARRTRSVALLTTLVLAAGLLPGSVSATPTRDAGIAGGAAPGACAQIKPANEVEEGMLGRGWTVVQGFDPSPFRVEILGKLRDGIAPGRDMIIVEVSDVAGRDFIDRARGIWAGMSGSPVYIDGELIGAVAYGFSLGPSKIGGVTPAEDMARVLEYGDSTAAPDEGADSIRVPASMRSRLAARAGVSEQEADSFERLQVPFAVSGIPARARDDFQQEIDRAGIRGFVTPGARAGAPSGTPAYRTPVPGGNFAGVISYGDLTVGGIGTTTYVCGGRALAFGHPLTFGGQVGFGANDAYAIAIIDDPTLTPFKLAQIRGLFGLLDQDRLSAIRARLGVAPSLIPIESRVTALDSGRSRDGQTDVTQTDWVPILSAFHLLFNIDTVVDRVGGGSSWVQWTVNGRRANGDPWQLRRSNVYASEFDISFQSIFEIFVQLAKIERNRFEKITFEDVSLKAKVRTAFRQYSIEGVEISKNGGPYREREQLRVQPGDELRMRVSLRQFRGGLTQANLSLTVPSDASGEGFLEVLGGSGGGGFGGEGVAIQGGGDEFERLLRRLENAPRNNELRAELSFFGQDFDPTPVATDSERLDRVVQGRFQIFVQAPFQGG